MDLISRQSAIDALDTGLWGKEWDKALATAMLKALPSAEPKQKTGHWIDKTRGDQKNSECSECHTLFRVLIKDYPYCPVCGSRNRGEEE